MFVYTAPRAQTFPLPRRSWQFCDFQFLFINDDNIYFVTSDNPVTHYDFTLFNSPYSPPPNSTTIEVIVPLTSKIVLLINNINLKGYKGIDYNFVREVNNRVIANHPKMYIISPRVISEEYYKNTIQRFRQSFLLRGLRKNLDAKQESRMKKYGIVRK